MQIILLILKSSVTIIQLYVTNTLQFESGVLSSLFKQFIKVILIISFTALHNILSDSFVKLHPRQHKAIYTVIQLFTTRNPSSFIRT